MIHPLVLSLKANVCVQWRVLTWKGYSLHFCCFLNMQAGACCCKKEQITEAHQQMEQKGGQCQWWSLASWQLFHCLRAPQTRVIHSSQRAQLCLKGDTFLRQFGLKSEYSGSGNKEDNYVCCRKPKLFPIPHCSSGALFSAFKQPQSPHCSDRPLVCHTRGPSGTPGKEGRVQMSNCRYAEVYSKMAAWKQSGFVKQDGRGPQGSQWPGFHEVSPEHPLPVLPCPGASSSCPQDHPFPQVLQSLHLQFSI